MNAIGFLKDGRWKERVCATSDTNRHSQVLIPIIVNRVCLGDFSTEALAQTPECSRSLSLSQGAGAVGEKAVSTASLKHNITAVGI